MGFNILNVSLDTTDNEYLLYLSNVVVSGWFFYF